MNERHEQKEALKVPKSDPEEAKRNEERLQHSLMATIAVPMKLAVTANSLWPTLKELAAVANIACKSDLQVGVKSIETGVWGAYQNVVTNAKEVKDAEQRKKLLADAESELRTAQENCADVLKILDGRSGDV